VYSGGSSNGFGGANLQASAVRVNVGRAFGPDFRVLAIVFRVFGLWQHPFLAQKRQFLPVLTMGKQIWAAGNLA
jgi:hypothetical protein